MLLKLSFDMNIVLLYSRRTCYYICYLTILYSQGVICPWPWYIMNNFGCCIMTMWYTVLLSLLYIMINRRNFAIYLFLWFNICYILYSKLCQTWMLVARGTTAPCISVGCQRLDLDTMVTVLSLRLFSVLEGTVTVFKPKVAVQRQELRTKLGNWGVKAKG